MIGKFVYVIPVGRHTLDYPFACAPGIRGGDGSNPSEQTSNVCAGLCPAGFTCGGGADGYQDESLFELYGLKLQHQSFKHPLYSQQGQQNFVSGLSVIDAVMNLGWNGVGELLRWSKC